MDVRTLTDDTPRIGTPALWQPVAIFLAGVVVTGLLMMVRGDFLGRRAAEETELRLSSVIEQTENRLNTRMDREMVGIYRELREIKDSLVRMEERANE